MKPTFTLSTAFAFLLYLPHHHLPSNACHAKLFLNNMPTFLRNGSKRVGFSPHNVVEPMPLQSLRPCMDKDKQILSRFSSSPARFLRRIKGHMARTLSLFTTKQHSCNGNGPSNQIPNRFVPPRDSHHSEALEDCIEFINSSHRKSM